MLPKGYGFGIPHQRAENDPDWYDIALGKIKHDCWINWLYGQTMRDKYVPMLWRCNAQWVMMAADYARSLGDRFWLLGNEPNLAKQSNTPPAQFVEATIMWREQVGGEIGLPGIFWDRFGHGKQWLDEYIRLGGPLPDAWSVHLYQMRSDSWIETLPEMLEYLRKIADLPVLLTECGCSLDDDEFIYSIVEQAKKAVRVGDVRAAFWFSAYYERDMPWNNLLTYDGELTQWGELWNQGWVNTYLPNVGMDHQL
jgi:hypothetical protein